MIIENEINQVINKGHNKAIATKILDNMDKLRRKNTNDSSKRRWVWELLQNAKDVRFDDTISIEIRFDKAQSFLEFSHNGKPFSLDNIIYLIQQVSSKEREISEDDQIKTTGKFGTGFLTTHLLSEIVQVEGQIDFNNNSYKNFNLLLDRSGREIGLITERVNNSIALLKNLDKEPNIIDFDPKNLNTTFRYNLNEKGLKVADYGISDLKIAMPFTLAFLSNKTTVSLPFESITYQELSRINLNEQIKLVKILKVENENEEIQNIILIEEDNVSIAIEVEITNDIFSVKQISELIPRLFCDFPLIGTEDFYFPVIVNSPFFAPTEPRDGICLIDTDTVDDEIEENKKLMTKALELYYVLLDFASKNNWQNMFHLISVKETIKDEWLSKTWFETELLKPAREYIAKTPIVDTEKGERLSIKNMENKLWFPSSSNEVVIEKIWDLMNSWIPDNLPRKKEIHSWYKVRWSDFEELNLSVISNSIQSRKSIEGVAKALKKEESETISWLNSYYDLLNFEGEFLSKIIISDEYEIIPNQKGDLKKRNELFVDTDNQIEEELKNTLEILEVKCRELLVHDQVTTGEGIKYAVKSQDNIISEINQILKSGKNNNSRKAISHLISLFADTEGFPSRRSLIYDYCKDLLKDEIPQKKLISKWSESIWEHCDNPRVKTLVAKISEQNNIETLSSFLNFNDNNKTIEWLNGFINFLELEEFENLLDSKILPNQNRDFRTKDSLLSESENANINEQLKDIAQKLGHDFREELLDKNIDLKLPEKSIINQNTVTEKIAKLVELNYKNSTSTEDVRLAFNLLLRWFNNNKEIAQEQFEDLFKNKHKLYNDDEIADNMQKASTFNEIMEEFGINDENELRERLKEDNKQSLIPMIFEAKGENDESIWKELALFFIEKLKEVGIKDMDTFLKFISEIKEGNILVKSGVRKDTFTQNSTLNTESTELDSSDYVKRITIDAVEKVITHLKTLDYYFVSRNPDYFNIFEVQKENKVFNLIIRPSNGKRYQLYQHERVLLLNKETELWLSNGFDVKQESFYEISKRMFDCGASFIPTSPFLPGHRLIE